MAGARKLGVKTSQETNRDVITFLLLFLLAFLPYSNIFFNWFVNDDAFQVVTNPYAHSFKYLRQIFTTSVWSFLGAQGISNYYRKFEIGHGGDPRDCFRMDRVQGKQSRCDQRHALSAEAPQDKEHQPHHDSIQQDIYHVEAEGNEAGDANVEAYDQLGDIYLSWQDFPRAEKAFRSALAGSQFDTHAHFGLGRVLEFTSRPADALREYESGLAMDPTDATAKASAIRLRAAASPPTSPH